jgi:hypothetical protein
LTEAASRTIETEALASIHSLFVSDELLRGDVLVELEPGVQIAQVDVETQRVMYQTETIRRIGGSRWTDRVFAVRVQFDAPAEGDARQRAQERTNRLLRHALDCLRLCRPDRIYYGGIIHRATSRVDHFHWPWPDNLLPMYPFDSQADIDRVARLWSLMRSRAVRDRQFLALAIRWFSSSAEAASLEDEMIFLMTAAEALFRAGVVLSRKGEHIANAAVALGLSSIQGENVHQHLMDSYDLRNEVLHEGHVAGWRPTSGERLSPNELVEFVAIASAHVRTAVRTLLEHTAGNAEVAASTG